MLPSNSSFILANFNTNCSPTTLIYDFDGVLQTFKMLSAPHRTISFRCAAVNIFPSIRHCDDIVGGLRIMSSTHFDTLKLFYQFGDSLFWILFNDVPVGEQNCVADVEACVVEVSTATG